MHKQKIFPLRIPAEERRRAQRIAREMSLSENRLYADLIQEGLLIREQLAYFGKLRSMRVPPAEGLALLDLAPDVEPSAEDRLSRTSITREADASSVARRPRIRHPR